MGHAILKIVIITYMKMKYESYLELLRMTLPANIFGKVEQSLRRDAFQSAWSQPGVYVENQC